MKDERDNNNTILRELYMRSTQAFASLLFLSIVLLAILSFGQIVVDPQNSMMLSGQIDAINWIQTLLPASGILGVLYGLYTAPMAVLRNRKIAMYSAGSENVKAVNNKSWADSTFEQPTSQGGENSVAANAIGVYTTD